MRVLLLLLHRKVSVLAAIASIETTRKIPVSYDQSVVDLIASRCTELESGGRMIDAILTNTMLPRISREYLEGISAGKSLSGIRMGVNKDEFAYEFDY